MDNQPKKHFEMLDGLRGIAAIAVVLFHFMEIATPDYSDSFIPRSYLAVDFFFCLSGFVIAYAYDDRISRLGISNFLKLRLIRLHPLVVIGTFIGLLAFIYDPFNDLAKSFTPLQKIGMLLSGITLIPYPIVPQRYFNLFHLNPPTWTLLWEYIGNILYAVLLIRISKKVLWILVFIGAVLLCAVSMHSGYLAVGFGGDDFLSGGVRLWFSFLMGILIFRSRWILSNIMSFFTFACLLSVVFVIPFSPTYGKFIDPIIVLFYFPFLVALGNGNRFLQGNKICHFLGDISYPLYIIHYPAIWIFMSYVEKFKPSMSEMTAIIILGTLLLIGISYLVLCTIDEPIRKYLRNRLQV
jgi:peptidoglycan/LPS O-acetylase OafA/YrhL